MIFDDEFGPHIEGRAYSLYGQLWTVTTVHARIDGHFMLIRRATGDGCWELRNVRFEPGRLLGEGTQREE